MREILIEMEHILFSDSKVKILAVDATGRPELDKSKLEGINVILKKYIREILLHFNLPFEKESLEPSRSEIIKVAGETFEEVIGIKLKDLNLNIYKAIVKIDEVAKQDSDTSQNDLQPKARRLSYHEKKELEKLPSEIEQLEIRLDEIQQEMNTITSDAGKLMDLQRELEEKEEALMALYERQEELATFN